MNAKLAQYLLDNCNTIDREARFDDMLDELYSFEKVGGPFAHMSPSRVLKECDPVAYRCGVNDFEDSEGWVEYDGSYYDPEDFDKAKEALAIDIELDDLAEAQRHLEDMEDSEEEADSEELAVLQQRIEALEKEIEEIRNEG